MIEPYWSKNGIVIFCADNREVLPQLEKFDLALTDPPYGIGADARLRNRVGKQHGKAEAPSKNYDLLLTDPPYGIGESLRNHDNRKYMSKVPPVVEYEKSDWDNQPPSRKILNAFRALATSQIIFGGNYFWLPPTLCWLVWDKLNGSNDYADCELAWTNLKKAVRRLQYRWHGMIHDGNDVRYHPTQKPLAVMQWCIRQAPKDVKTILDPWMGVGTTLCATKLTGLQAVGIEQSEEYCKI